jgi:hypothetical protein
MKKYVALSLILGIVSISANAQVGKFIKNVSKNVQKDLVGTPKTGSNTKTMPEPSCACEPSDLMIDIGKYNIGYTEATISMLDDGRILLADRMTDSYYISNNGVTEGPYKKDDPRVAQFETMIVGADNHAPFTERYKKYISKKGDKYLITIAGKTYGPYGQINNFSVSLSGDKFAAMVTQTVLTTADEAKKMEEEVNNAKSDEEKMQIAMKYSQQMQQKMLDGGGANGILPKLVTNLPVAPADNYSPLSTVFYSNLKYDNIFTGVAGKILDFQGKTILDLTAFPGRIDNAFIKSDNSGYAWYDSGVLTFSDGKKLTELFNPHLMKLDGKIYLAYMYYSPKHNAIMQCKVPF